MGSISNPRCKMGCMNFAFNDPSHKQYHAGAVKVYCGKTNKLEKQNLKNLSDLHDGLTDKRRMKLLKSVSKNLLLMSVTFSQDADKSLLQEVRGQNFSDALHVLMTQLEQEKAEYKERKKAMKAKKKTIKAQKKVQNKCEDESSSCDSTSCEYEVVDVAQLCMTQPAMASMTRIHEPPQITGDAITVISMEENGSKIEGLHGEFAEGEKGVRMRGVEVCMGGKCKKLGSEQLLAAFEERINVSGMGCGVKAVGCKCMGKCRNAPNVRLQGDFCQELHMGVGIADVGFVLDHHFGVKQEEDEFLSKDVVCV
ncbi:hypothetical protein SUGI_0123340 [Cryptomeria japonica]|nr:hypothetical protein SUGI_0123340 [Cryptomeria japonica]